jgi:hypothetical protein
MGETSSTVQTTVTTGGQRYGIRVQARGARWTPDQRCGAFAPVCLQAPLSSFLPDAIRWKGRERSNGRVRTRRILSRTTFLTVPNERMRPGVLSTA